MYRQHRLQRLNDNIVVETDTQVFWSVIVMMQMLMAALFNFANFE